MLWVKIVVEGVQGEEIHPLDEFIRHNMADVVADVVEQWIGNRDCVATLGGALLSLHLRTYVLQTSPRSKVGIWRSSRGS